MNKSSASQCLRFQPPSRASLLLFSALSCGDVWCGDHPAGGVHPRPTSHNCSTLSSHQMPVPGQRRTENPSRELIKWLLPASFCVFSRCSVRNHGLLSTCSRQVCPRICRTRLTAAWVRTVSEQQQFLVLPHCPFCGSIVRSTLQRP